MQMADEEPEKPSATIHRLPKNPWSIAGLHTLDSLPDRPAGKTWRPGFVEWLGKVELAPGMLSVVTGLPGSGKTHLWAQIWSNIVGANDIVAMIASFECLPKPHYRRYLREIFARCREAEMSERQIAQADRFIGEHYRFLVHPEEAPTLSWFLEMAEVAVRREGVKVIQLDPWNRLESQRGERETEPEYVARCLRALHVFAKETGCHVQIVAHPAKRDARRRDIPPDLEDISGAMHWWNMIDQGFVVHRKELWTADGNRCFDAVFYHRKARFDELGYPCELRMRFNPQSRVFESVTTREAA
jgi:twinkle protein